MRFKKCVCVCIVLFKSRGIPFYVFSSIHLVEMNVTVIGLAIVVLNLRTKLYGVQQKPNQKLKSILLCYCHINLDLSIVRIITRQRNFCIKLLIFLVFVIRTKISLHFQQYKPSSLYISVSDIIDITKYT